jgi:hypothetical protein
MLKNQLIVECLQELDETVCFYSLTCEFCLHVVDCVVAKISVCFNNYSPHLKPPVFGSSNVCVLHDKPTHCFGVFTEAVMKIFLIVLPYGEHMLFDAPLTILEI